jgi:hypothetical protein
MTMTPEQIESLELSVLPEATVPEPVPALQYQLATNENFRLVDAAIGELRDDLRRRRLPRERRPRRTGAPARLAADDFRFFLVILGGVVLFALASFAASFAGQYAMARNTGLPELLWWLVPLFIDLPIIVLSLATLIFRARGQHDWHTWAVVVLLTGLSSAINVAHVYAVGAGAAGSIGLGLGAVVMGGAPWLVLISFEELGRLGIKPPEKKRPAPPARKTTTKKASR